MCISFFIIILFKEMCKFHFFKFKREYFYYLIFQYASKYREDFLNNDNYFNIQQNYNNNNNFISNQEIFNLKNELKKKKPNN